jgi:hypothetical protein
VRAMTPASHWSKKCSGRREKCSKYAKYSAVHPRALGVALGRRRCRQLAMGDFLVNITGTKRHAWRVDDRNAGGSS